MLKLDKVILKFIWKAAQCRAAVEATTCINVSAAMTISLHVWLLQVESSKRFYRAEIRNAEWKAPMKRSQHYDDDHHKVQFKEKILTSNNGNLNFSQENTNSTGCVRVSFFYNPLWAYLTFAHLKGPHVFVINWILHFITGQRYISAFLHSTFLLLLRHYVDTSSKIIQISAPLLLLTIFFWCNVGLWTTTYLYL